MRLEPMKNIAILTSGGDSPGMNQAIWAATQSLERAGAAVFAVRGGFAGLLAGDFFRIDSQQALRHCRRGGTWLGTARETQFAERLSDASAALYAHQIAHLMVLGGNGSLRGAAALAGAGLCVVGLPATIDNDVQHSEDSIGFDTATNSGVVLLDQFRDTAEALPRLCALETLGGNTGFLARAIFESAAADALLIPEAPLLSVELEAQTKKAILQHNHALIVASEGYPELEAELYRLEAAVGLRLRFARPSHTMRGGAPSAHDRRLANTLAQVGAVKLLEDKSGVVLWQQGTTKFIEF
jgi:6-phosphofructokinase 1